MLYIFLFSKPLGEKNGWLKYLAVMLAFAAAMLAVVCLAFWLLAGRLPEAREISSLLIGTAVIIAARLAIFNRLSLDRICNKLEGWRLVKRDGLAFYLLRGVYLTAIVAVFTVSPFIRMFEPWRCAAVYALLGVFAVLLLWLEWLVNARAEPVLGEKLRELDR